MGADMLRLHDMSFIPAETTPFLLLEPNVCVINESWLTVNYGTGKLLL